jgi:uncharacterized membrane protein YeaQ/YmgE (transglycosylase-associated protein family)
MTALEFLALLVVAGASGALGQALAGGGRKGCLFSVLLGLVGAWIGRWLADAFDLPRLFVIEIDGRPFPVVWAVLGAALFVMVLSILQRKR